MGIVDDESTICGSLSRLLRGQNLDLVCYSSAEAFLAAEKAPKFGCLLLDIQLGGMSGLEFLRRLAGQKKHPPVLFITANEDPEIRLQPEALGCLGYFRKTSPGNEIAAAIRSATHAPVSTPPFLRLPP